MNLMSLEIDTVGYYRRVTFLNEELAKFDVMSDDYAYTHALDFKDSFAESWQENQSLPWNERVEFCKNYAYSKL